MVIRQLTLRRFGRFKDFTWYPSTGINCLVGPGDAGKTTILDAIARATSAAPATAAAEHDYFRRRTETGFEIELCIGDLSPEFKGAFRPPALWGWQAPGKQLLTAPVAGADAVLRILVRGTADLETEHRVLSPDGEELFLSVDRRRLLGLCRVGEMRGSSREFRMARGSLLERTLGREDVRGAAAVAVRAASEQLQLPEEVETRLATLGAHLHRDGITPRLWPNPWASRPLFVSLPFPRGVANERRGVEHEEVAGTPHSVLRLPQDWPGSEEPFTKPWST